MQKPHEMLYNRTQPRQLLTSSGWVVSTLHERDKLGKFNQILIFSLDGLVGLFARFLSFGDKCAVWWTKDARSQAVWQSQQYSECRLNRTIHRKLVIDLKRLIARCQQNVQCLFRASSSSWAPFVNPADSTSSYQFKTSKSEHWRLWKRSFAQHEKQEDRYAARVEKKKIDKENALVEQFKVAWASKWANGTEEKRETKRIGGLHFDNAIVGSTNSTLRQKLYAPQ